MANKCGDCKFFRGSTSKCGGGLNNRGSGSSACLNNFKAPASLFSSKKCGGCRFFKGSSSKCGGGLNNRNSGSSACPNNYAPIPG